MNKTLLVLTLASAMATSALADLSPLSEDFEGLNQGDVDALGNAGWLVFGNVFDSGGSPLLYQYGPFPAPNNFGSPAFSLISAGEGAPPQGAQGLVVFSDYNNGDHSFCLIIESNVYQEQTIGVADVGMTYRFQFDAKRGDLAGASTAAAFIKTVDPSAGFALTNFLTEDTTNLPVEWGTYTIDIEVDAGLVGQLLQFGFLNRASKGEPSGVFYDNVIFRKLLPCETRRPTWGCRVNGRLGPCVGTAGSDVILGTAAKDVIDGRGGDDYIHGFEKKDLLCGGGGDDVLIGGSGPDSLFGGNGDDILEGLGGRDDLNGGLGNDKLDGGGGNDTCTDPDPATHTYPFQSCEN